MSTETPGVWGIDLGQCSLKALRVEEQDGKLVATAFDYIEHPKILSQPDADPDQLTREALDKFLERNDLRGDAVSVGVPGQSGLARFVKLPPVEEGKIADIVRFEAKQQIPFNLDEVIWDYQKIGSGTVMDGLAMDYEIGLFAMKRDQVQTSLQHYRDVNIDVDVIQMTPLALCNFVAYEMLGKGNPDTDESGGDDSKSKKCVVALDIGAEGSNLIITNGERVIWQKPINTGGNNFTRALTKELKLTFAKAEHTKRNATKSPDLRRILAALKPVLNDLVNELQRSLGYFNNTHRDAQIEYLLGLGNAFRLPGLQKYLQEKLGIPVKKCSKLRRLSGDSVLGSPVFTENILSFAVAYGLALQGLQSSRLYTNLLPGEIVRERMIKAKKPWAAAAAALLLLGLGGVALGTALDYRSYSHKKIDTAISSATAASSAVQQAESTYSSTKSAALAEEAGVKGVVAGQDERLNWLHLLEFVGKTIPKPDASNLTPDAQRLYFVQQPDATDRQEAMPGKEALAELIKRQQGTAGNAAPPPGEEGAPIEDPLGRGIGDLIQINVESVNCRYSNNLGGYWTQVRKTVTNRALVRPVAQFDQPPEGEGWLVEIRGFTYHHRQRQFVLETFLENIARMGMPDFGKKPKPNPDNLGGFPDDPTATPEKDENPDPVLNRVSHVVLYTSNAVQSSSPTMALPSPLPLLLQSASAGGTGGAGGYPGPEGYPPADAGGYPGGEGEGQAGATVDPRSTWAPLGGTALSGEYGEGAGGARNPQYPTPTAPGVEGTEVQPNLRTRHTKTEFVIFFIWKEPTPSDELRSSVPLDSGGGADDGFGDDYGGY